MIDLTKPIEAYHPTQGVKPMTFNREWGAFGGFITDGFPDNKSNVFWRGDGSDPVGTEWKIRNVRFSFDADQTEKAIELLKDAEEVFTELEYPETAREYKEFLDELNPDTPFQKLAKSLHYSEELLREKFEECGVELKDA